MSDRTKKIIGTVCILLAVAVLVGSALILRPNETNAAGQGQSASSQGKVRNFTLYVRQAQVKTPNGQTIWAFGFTDDPKGPAKIPGPRIVVDEGDTVNITLVNDKDPTKTQGNPEGDGHTIHLHGLDMPWNMDGDPMTAPGGHAVLEGTKFLYKFVAKYPGTYWYHCHEGAAEHIQMGMYGALVIRPKGQANRAYANTPQFDKDYTFLLSEMDSSLHAADYNALYKGGGEPNWTKYQPDYFFINGKMWPDTMMDPADNVNATVGQTVLVRLINAGYEVHSIHTHGFHFQVLGSDGRKFDTPYWKDTLSIAPGERYEILIKLDQVGRFMIHDHVEQFTTNDGEYTGGMLSMISVNNKDGSNPVPMSQMMGG